MDTKFTASMLIATALPCTKALAQSVDSSGAPVTSYLCLMLAIGVVYGAFLALRIYRRKQEQEQKH